jgi:hypothetical protein
VTGYRLYFFDAEGHIGHRLEFDCGSDEEALALAEQHRAGGTVELWCGTRLVREIVADVQA